MKRGHLCFDPSPLSCEGEFHTFSIGPTSRRARILPFHHFPLALSSSTPLTCSDPARVPRPNARPAPSSLRSNAMAMAMMMSASPNESRRGNPQSCTSREFVSTSCIQYEQMLCFNYFLCRASLKSSLRLGAFICLSILIYSSHSRRLLQGHTVCSFIITAGGKFFISNIQLFAHITVASPSSPWPAPPL